MFNLVKAITASLWIYNPLLTKNDNRNIQGLMRFKLFPIYILASFLIYINEFYMLTFFLFYPLTCYTLYRLDNREEKDSMALAYLILTSLMFSMSLMMVNVIIINVYLHFAK